MTYTQTIPKVATREAARFTVWASGLALGLLFIGLGGTRFLDSDLVDEFTRLGIPSWARILLGSAEIAGGLLFCLPRTGSSGASVLGAVLLSAIGSFVMLRSHGLPFPLLPLVLVGLLALITWGRLRLAWWDRYVAMLEYFASRRRANF
jgi:hypothetical protein